MTGGVDTDRPRYDSTTALVVVDVQNDFADPSGSLYVAGGETTVPFINDEIAAATAAGAMVVSTQDWHPPTTPHFAKDGGIWPVHCVADTWGAELHPDLRVTDPTVRKGIGEEDGYSGFTTRHPVTGEETPTALQQRLVDRGVTRLVVVGLATDYCVKGTAIDGARLGYPTTVLADGIRPVDLAPGDGARAVVAMVAAGVTVV
jgi:nicotinamidase/pyrazinamidase